jgi:arylsulfatase A-like enzyme
VANWPGKLTPRKCTTPMHVVDWFPTIAALVDYQAPQGVTWDGVNQWAALQGDDASEPRSIFIAMRGGRALRHGDWKLIVRDSGDPELYNIAADPYEQQDLAATYPHEMARLSELLAAEAAKDDPVLPADLKGLPS